MKDKLEVGHFIRTIKGIGRIEEITEDRTEIYFNCDTGLTISFIKKDFTQEEMAQYYKHSDNIIDLIEVGDYVNGYYVSKIWKSGEITHYVDEKPIQRKEKQITIQAPSYGGIIHLHNEDIKSILTKEQFSSIEYRLGDDK